MLMEIKSITPDGLFRLFTACPDDPKTFILDVRPQKDFQKSHIMQSYCIRLAANGQALVDYSKNTYSMAWQKDCWWDKPVVIYGEANLKKDHPVVAFLAADKHAKSIAIFREGFQAFQKAYSFLCTASVKNNATKRYPGEIVPGALYLGAWQHAEDTERLDELSVKRVISVHNSPENLKLPSRFKHLRFQLADVDTQDISQFFDASYKFIEEGRGAKEAALVHCGAGVSRSAALCIAYLMRRFTWPAHRARAHCQQRRSIVSPNQGFWRSLCALEEQLGITERSNPADTVDFHGADAPVQLAEGAAGQKVAVKMVKVSKAQQDAAQAAAAGKLPSVNGHSVSIEGLSIKQRVIDDSAEGSGEGSGADKPSRDKHARTADGGRSKDGEKDRHSDRHERTRDSDGHRDRDRSRGRDRHRDRSRERDKTHRRRSHSRNRRRSGGDKDRGRHERGGGRGHDDREASREQEQKRYGGEDSSATKADATAAEEPKAGVILEVMKDGKAVGGIELGLQSIAEKVIFGRAPTCDVPLEHLSISRQHAVLSTDTAGNLYLTDMGSAHGTNLEGVWVRANEARLLNKGAVFKFGASSREYKITYAAQPHLMHEYLLEQHYLESQ